MEYTSKTSSLILDSIPHLVCSIRENGEIAYCNQTFREQLAMDPGVDEHEKSIYQYIHECDLNFRKPSNSEQEKKETERTVCRLKATKHRKYRWHLMTRTKIRHPDDPTIRWVITSTDLDEEKNRETTLNILARTNEIFASSLDYSLTLENIAKLAVETIASLCIVDLIEEGITKRVAVAHRDPDKKDLIEQLKKVSPALEAPQGPGKVMKTGKHQLITDFSQMNFAGMPSNCIELLTRLGAASLMTVPLIVRNSIIGALTFISDQKTRYTENDLPLAYSIARNAALAVDNARLYKTMQKAVKEREEVISILSHDLKNPLSAIQLNTDVLKRLASSEMEDTTQPVIRQLFANISIASSRIMHLITDLLDTAKIESGVIPVEKKPNKIGEILNDALQVLSVLAEEKGIRLETNVENANTEVACDRERILQLFSNLIENAIKYSAKNSKIIISFSSKDADQLLGCVEDNGPGISKENLPHIFDRFWQARNNRKPGSGLGLAIAKGIVDAHGGKIWAESVVGKGSKFYFSLPTKPSPKPAQDPK
ncbi:MAG: hypothetical protein A3K03_11900 [Bdellovibrionales bacterium RIFOXYD1_FULL_44_7]|nr:MAG: hypothetical protein A3K03_11900 [Bdellovibrionales bacterium RIFOXYD1_FULL_44_7]